MNKLKFSSYLIITILLTLGLSVSLQSLLASWTAPTDAPPNANTYAPVYASSSALQIIKGDGGFGVAGGFSSMDASFLGNVGIGTTSLEYQLYVKANQEDAPQFLFNQSLDTWGYEEVMKVEFYDPAWGSGQDNTTVLKVISNGNISAGCTDCGQLDLVHTGSISEDTFYALGVRTTDSGALNAYIQHDGDAYFSGNVGIGTTAPDIYDGQQAKLDVDGYAAANDIWLKDANTGAGAWASDSGGGGGGMSDADIYSSPIIYKQIANGDFNPGKTYTIDVASIAGISNDAKALLVHASFRTGESQRGKIAYTYPGEFVYKYICGSGSIGNDSVDECNLTHGQNFLNWYKLKNGKITFYFFGAGSPSLVMDIQGEIR